MIEHIGSNIYKVIWEPSLDNGSPLMAYSLEGMLGDYDSKTDEGMRNRRQAANFTQNFIDSEPINEDWQEFYNGTG